ncbi:hypothetical protein SDC9_80684 [bioreactor metagenome]|uniref:Uncharacterized protein n=1 Tax=bioreactor metagenome TaxID=1076179 RepID=A0A644Z039_9ZZZZ
MGLPRGVDDDRAVGLQAGGHVHAGQQGFVHHHHIIRVINVGMDGNSAVADAVVRRDGRAHPLGAVFRKALHALA